MLVRNETECNGLRKARPLFSYKDQKHFRFLINKPGGAGGEKLIIELDRVLVSGVKRTQSLKMGPEACKVTETQVELKE